MNPKETKRDSCSIPMLSYDLIHMLDKEYPLKRLSQSDFDKTEREIFYVAGQRSVVDSLLRRLEETSPEEALLSQMKGD